MAASKPRENINLEDLYKCHWFFGELSDEEAKEILIEAKKKEPNSEVKSILFLKTRMEAEWTETLYPCQWTYSRSR